MFSREFKKKVLPFILPIVLLIIWFLITDVFSLFPSYFLPSPTDVVNSFIGISSDGSLLENTISTLVKVLLGIGLATVIAVPLGIILGWSPTCKSASSLLISILRPIPPIAWIPFAILWLGIGLPSSVFVIFLGCAFPILVTTMDGVQRTDAVLIEAAKSFGATKWQILSKVIVPASIPNIVSGIKVGVGIALMCTVSAEMIASSSGLGYMILTASNLFNPGLIVVGMLVIGLIGIIFDLIFSRIQSKFFW